MSVFKPENSMVAGLAVVGLVIADYNLHNGTATSVQAADAWHPTLTASNKKAGWSSLALVAGISLLARDANVFILGCAAILAMHSSYIHSIAVHPDTGQIIAPNPSAAYQPAQAAAAAA
jgi:hypothetical protein